MTENGRIHIFVSGRVQGVFFREKTREKAIKLGVFGWVRNLSDGRVEVILEGEKDKVEEVVKWLRKGPLWAKVDDIEIEQQEYKSEFENFDIKYII